MTLSKRRTCSAEYLAVFLRYCLEPPTVEAPFQLEIFVPVVLLEYFPQYLAIDIVIGKALEDYLFRLC